jgi:hypothetical protein
VFLLKRSCILRQIDCLDDRRFFVFCHIILLHGTSLKNAASLPLLTKMWDGEIAIISGQNV